MASELCDRCTYERQVRCQDGRGYPACMDVRRCNCGHVAGWHRKNIGSCIECACPVFVEEFDLKRLNEGVDVKAVGEGIAAALGLPPQETYDSGDPAEKLWVHPNGYDDLTSVPVRVGEPGDVSVGSGGGSAIRRHPAAVILGRMYASWLRWPR